jgi:excisionase family DNA binding protein
VVVALFLKKRLKTVDMSAGTARMLYIVKRFNLSLLTKICVSETKGVVTNMDKYFTTRQVAEMLKFSVLTIRNYCFTGRIKCIRFGREFAITQENVDEFKRLTRAAMNESPPGASNSSTAPCESGCDELNKTTLIQTTANYHSTVSRELRAAIDNYHKIIKAGGYADKAEEVLGV